MEFTLDITNFCFMNISNDDDFQVPVEKVVKVPQIIEKLVHVIHKTIKFV